MWHKTESKPELVASMVRQVMPEFSQKKNVMNEIYPIISALIPPEYRNQILWAENFLVAMQLYGEELQRYWDDA